PSAPLLPPSSFPTRRSSDLIATHDNGFRHPCFGIQFGVDFSFHSRFTLHFGNTSCILKVSTSNSSPLALPDPVHRAGPVCFHARSAEHTSELQSRFDLVCRL